MPQDQKLQNLLLQRQLKVENPAALEALRDIFPRPQPVPPEIDDQGKVLTHGYAPSPLKPDPLVLGSPELANTVDNVLRMVPGLKGSYDHIQEGPTPEVFSGLARTLGSNAGSMQGTNLAGATTKATPHRIAINPDFAKDPITVTHELGHANGLSELGAQLLETLFKRATGSHEMDSMAGIRLSKMPMNTLIDLLRGSKKYGI